MTAQREMLKLLGAGIAMGSWPCLAFWGPILLPYIAATKRSWRGGLRVSLMFSFGRLLAIAILGALASVAFASVNRFFPPHRSGYLYLAIAVLVMLMGVLIILDKGFRVPVYGIFRKYMVGRSNESMLVLGFLIGISPCAPLIAILSYIACTATSLLYGVLYALSFGIGTMVSVIVLGTLAGFLPGSIFTAPRHLKVFRIVCGVILILFGFQLIYYLWQLL